MKNKRTVLTRLPKAQQGMPVPAPGSRPEEQGMPEQGMPQGEQMAPPQQGGQDQQMQALLQEVASMLQQGADPMTIIGGLLQSGLAPEIVMQVVLETGMAQDEQTASQMIQETMAQMQQGGGQQGMPAEGQPAPEQMQGQPMMALGGETALNDTILEFAQLTGQDQKDVEDLVTKMIQDGTDVQTITDQLEQAITEIQTQQAQPQGMGGGMQQTQPGESQIAAPTMRYGGPTPMDFKEIGQQMIKQYRTGGSSMGELDTSNTQAYIQNLKGAISNWVTTNNKIGLIKKRTEKNLELFDELPESVAMLPRAVKGIEIKGVTYKHINDLNKAWDAKVITDEEYKKAIEDQKKDSDLFEVVEPEKKTETKTETNTNTNTGTESNLPKQGESYDQWAIRTGKTSQPGAYSNMVWNGTSWSDTGVGSNDPQYYYPGQYSDYGRRSMSGQLYRQNNRFMNSITGIAQELNRGNVNPFIQGIGALAGSSQAEVTKKLQEVLSDPTRPYIIQDIQRRGILGREKKGKRNVVGQRIIWNPTTGKAETTTTDNATDPKATTTTNTTVTDGVTENKPPLSQDPNNIAALDKQMRELLNSPDRKERKLAEEYFKEKGMNPETQKDPQFDGKAYTEYLDKEEKLKEQAIKNLGPNATDDAIYNEMDRLEEKGMDAPYEKPADVVKSVVDDLNRAYSITDPVTNQERFSGSPTLTNPDYFKPGNSAWFGKNYENSGLDSFDSMDPKTTGFNWENEVSADDPAYKEYIKANPGAYDIKGRPELEFYGEDNEGMRWYLNNKTKKYEKFNPTGSTGYDPNTGFLEQGGELDEKLVWDFKNKKYKNAPMLIAKNGLPTPKMFVNPFNMFAEKSDQTGSGSNAGTNYQDYTEGVEMVQQKRGLNWDTIANSVYGVGSYLNEKKRLLNAATSKYEAADARAGMFNPITPRSESEGLYTQFGDFIPDRTGARVMPGTGTDAGVYGEGMANNIYEDINPGGVNLFSRKGGILKFAENGIEIDTEYELSQEDLDELMPYLQQLGLKIEMV